MIEEGTNEFRNALITNRKATSLIYFIKKYVHEGTLFKSDAHKSYHRVVSSINETYKIVNHSLGYKNDERKTTNLIEDFKWRMRNLRQNK